VTETAGPGSQGPPEDPKLEAGLDPEAVAEARARAQERQRKIRRVTNVVLALLAVALSVRAVVGKHGFLEAHRSKRELTRLQADVTVWRERNEALATRIKALKEDPSTVEAIARERLGWSKPGEITFLFPYDPAAPDRGVPDPVSPGEFTPTIGSELEDLAAEGTAAAPAPSDGTGSAGAPGPGSASAPGLKPGPATASGSKPGPMSGPASKSGPAAAPAPKSAPKSAPARPGRR
jgi:cell division protein FtsB